MVYLPDAPLLLPNLSNTVSWLVPPPNLLPLVFTNLPGNLLPNPTNTVLYKPLPLPLAKSSSLLKVSMPSILRSLLLPPKVSPPNLLPLVSTNLPGNPLPNPLNTPWKTPKSSHHRPKFTMDLRPSVLLTWKERLTRVVVNLPYTVLSVATKPLAVLPNPLPRAS